MSRKNRSAEETNPTQNQTGAEMPKDSFQEQGERVVETASKLFEGKGKQIRNAVIAIAVIALVGGAVYLWMGRAEASAQAALGKALAITESQIVEIPASDSTEVTFKTGQERDAAALKAFDQVAKEHGGDVGEKAKFLAATIRLKSDRKAALDTLKGLSDASTETGELAKFAMAQALTDDGKFDDAIAMYNKILSASQSVVPSDKVQFEIASILEKQGKSSEAVNKYIEIAKKGLEAKDKDGNPAQPSASATKAKQRVEKLDPEKAKTLVPAPIVAPVAK